MGKAWGSTPSTTKERDREKERERQRQRERNFMKQKKANSLTL
jgi:hypothetical protein